MTLNEATVLSLKVLKQVMEEKLTSSNIQVANVTKENGFKILTESQISEFVEQLA
jgi:20S proteasome subunit alpha 5